MNSFFLIGARLLVLKSLVCFFMIMLGFSRAYAEFVLIDGIKKEIMLNNVRDVSREVLRDPTKPLYSMRKNPVVSAPLILQAVFMRTDNRSAIVNGKFVRVGDVVFNHKVVAINAKAVSLEKENKKIILDLRGMGDAGL